MGFFRMGEKLTGIDVEGTLSSLNQPRTVKKPEGWVSTNWQCRKTSSNPELFCALPKDHGGQCGGDSRNCFSPRQPGEKEL